MNAFNHPIQTAADVLAMLQASSLPEGRRRDLTSALNRVCEMNGVSPTSLKLDVPILRKALAIKPAAHGITSKTFSNIRSAFVAAMDWAGVSAPLARGMAGKDRVWSLLAAGISHDKQMSTGLAALMNWCAANGVAPAEVDDALVQRFAVWLETRTLHARPRHIAWSIPPIWNKARKTVPGWPATELKRITFRSPSENLRWEDLPAGLRADAESYLRMRAEPDIFDESPNAPKRAVAASTLHQQREHIRLSASVLLRYNWTPDSLATLADLVAPAALKAVLRHYHKKAEQKPNAFAVAIAKTLLAIARYHLRLPEAELRELKTIAGKLPGVPLELTEKNKDLLRVLEGDRMKAQLLYLPETLMKKAHAELADGRLPLVLAQMAVAVDILLFAPLRPQNLAALNWQRHFRESNGSKGGLQLYVPKAETKSRKRDLTFDLPAEVAANIRWYRKEILSRPGADPQGDLFVNRHGSRKSQETLSQQLTETIAKHVGVPMTPHQFRHFAAALYLDQHPESFQNVSDLLGHAWAKTTLVYAGSSSRRASRAYGAHVIEQRKALKLKRARKGK
jgi:integrase